MTVTKDPSDLDRLLAELGRLAALPLEQATAMPPGVFTSEDFLALEQREIFAKEWLCAGRADAIPNPGDYLTYRIGDQPVFVIRGTDSSVRCFANVCRHRMMRLLEGTGNCKRIVCPYHAWTYRLDGQLIGAAYMEKSAGFDKTKVCLPEIRCELWQGWIYVTLDPDIAPVAERFAALHDIVAHYRMADYVQIVQEDHVWNTNWKCLTENFMEGYHLPVAHRRTVGGYFPARETRFSDAEADNAFTFQWFVKRPDAPVGGAHPDNTRLTGEWCQTSVMPTIFPSHMISLAPDHFWYLSLQPRGTDQVEIRYGAAFAPEVLDAAEDPDELIRQTKAFLTQVNEEDRFVVEGIFQGVRAPLSRPGPLSWLERENHDFARYLARRLSVAARSPGKARGSRPVLVQKRGGSKR